MASTAFDPNDFLTLARTLAVPPTEAGLRTSVGRAYYATFLVVRDKTRVRARRYIHAAVITTVRRRSGFRATGDQLDSLRRLRTVADYELLPHRASDRDWERGWRIAEHLARHVLTKIATW